MDEIIDENSHTMTRLWREIRTLPAQQEEIRQSQVAKFRDRQQFELKEAEQIRAKIESAKEDLSIEADALREEIEMNIRLRFEDLEREHASDYARLKELEESINSDRIGTNDTIQQQIDMIEAKKFKVSRQLDELHEISKRLMQNPDQVGRAQVVEDRPTQFYQQQQQQQHHQDPRPHVSQPNVRQQQVFAQTFDRGGIGSGTKRINSDHTNDAAHGPSKRARHTDSTLSQDEEVQGPGFGTPVAIIQAPDASGYPATEKKDPSPQAPANTQSVQKPKGLILASWQRDRLVNLDDIKGKEYVYIRHNVPRVLRCPHCPGFGIWPTRPTIKGIDKAHFIKSEFHRHQRATDGDVGPGRGREEGGGITSDWITRNFGWRVVNGVPKGSLEDWADRHNKDVDRCRNGEVINDIVFEPEPKQEEPKQQETKQQDPKQQEPKQQEPKHHETRQQNEPVIPPSETKAKPATAAKENSTSTPSRPAPPAPPAASTTATSTATVNGIRHGRSARSRSSMSAITTTNTPAPPKTRRRSEIQSPEKIPPSPESITRAAAREGGYSMRNIARRNYTVPGMDDIRDKA